jgi:enolase
MKITQLAAWEILASGGLPTLEVEATLEDGSTGRASVPYGASAGSHEATVLLDGEKRYSGNGMLKAVANVNTLAPQLIGMDAYDQRKFDEKLMQLDGTPNKATYGGNTLLALSLAVARAAAASQKKELYQHIADFYQTGVDFSILPKPMVVVIEGGKHADETTDLQEYCITGINPADTSTESIRKCLESYHQLKKVLKQNGLSTNVGNEGAFAPNGIVSNEAPFAFILDAIAKAGYTAGTDLGISIDAAASEFYKEGMYHLAIENRSLTADELIAYYATWLEKYPIVTIEDMLHEDDWDNWTKLMQVARQHNVELVGDDLTVTNLVRLQKAIDTDAISSILIKLNQIGTLTETVDVCMLAKKHNMMSVPSHRGGGETNDAAMVDLAVAVGGSYIKVGPTRGERVSKYNRLMEIERMTHAK